MWSKPWVVALAILSLAGGCFGQPKEPCFAFLLKGDVVAVCKGKHTQITHRGDIENFAVSDELSSLAYLTSRITKRDEAISIVAATVTIANLRTGASKQFHGERTRGVVSTCGRILEIEVGPGRPTSTDVVTGENLSFAPYIFFRCSEDQRVVAGILPDPNNGNKHGDLYFGAPPTTRIAVADDVYPHFFNVSPDGSRVAWFNDIRPLCVLSSAGAPECVDHSSMSDPVSVNNSGEVLVEDGTGEGCFYKTSYNFAPPRQGERANDVCSGIGYWKPGLKSIEFLEPIGRNPQWINPGTADLLRGWSTWNSRSR